MCGILGVYIPEKSKNKWMLNGTLKHLFLLSESRGKEASGMALCNGKVIRYIKSPFPASDLVVSDVFKKEVEILSKHKNEPAIVIGHSRLVTNGYEHDNINNQPVVKNNIVTVHNGIITNSNSLWEKYPDEIKSSDLDSELIPTLFSRFLEEYGSIPEALSGLYGEIYGMTSTAMLLSRKPYLLLSTNNGSLYYIYNETDGSFIFASERYILNQLIKKIRASWRLSIGKIKQLIPNTYLQLDYINKSLLKGKLFEVSGDSPVYDEGDGLDIIEICEKVSNKPVLRNTSLEHNMVVFPKYMTAEVERRRDQIQSMKRCTKCVLPETFPYIEFGEDGVCNYCHGYSPIKVKGKSAFIDLVESYRDQTGYRHDCLVPFSGGRDSSYVLHFLKNELKMNPIAFSYDWGMLTDLSRRNQARMCGALGVEHILISADIRKKRKNIQKNVVAWLKRPRLGTIPLFMAGDKQYFYFANLLMKQNGISLSILGENMLETTKFKSGFCGIRPSFRTEHTYTLSVADKIKMSAYYAKEYALNPAYINTSIFDTIDAFKSYYVIPHKNINFFDYIMWDEKEIAPLLIDEYLWETDPGTSTTWRIGDGTAAFYNYIYYMVAGFTENDTFRSNQIREGMLTRDVALSLTENENYPRFDSIKWYCDTIGIDFEKSVSIINETKPLF